MSGGKLKAFSLRSGASQECPLFFFILFYFKTFKICETYAMNIMKHWWKKLKNIHTHAHTQMEIPPMFMNREKILLKYLYYPALLFSHPEAHPALQRIMNMPITVTEFCTHFTYSQSLVALPWGLHFGSRFWWGVCTGSGSETRAVWAKNSEAPGPRVYSRRNGMVSE